MERFEQHQSAQSSQLFDYFFSLFERLKLQVSQCTICHSSSTMHPQICSHCLASLPFFDLDKVNGDLLNWPAMNQLFRKRHFDHLISVTPYEWPLSSWISQFKYQKRYDYGSLLGFLLQHHWYKTTQNSAPPDLLVSVPLHLKKWQFRGFNQAHILTKTFSKYHDIHYLENAFTRVRFQNSQVGKSGSKRRKSMVGTFKLIAPKEVANKSILLIDDVITTGSTVNELCKLLKSAGATDITVLTLCVSINKC